MYLWIKKLNKSEIEKDCKILSVKVKIIWIFVRCTKEKNKKKKIVLVPLASWLIPSHYIR